MPATAAAIAMTASTTRIGVLSPVFGVLLPAAWFPDPVPLSVWLLSDPEVPAPGFSTVESSINSYKSQKCGIFLSNFIFLYVACVACLWYNGLEVIMIEALF